ncbi:MAG TPA: hypothetical protein VN729_05585 [Ktedonobacteraceae bacterium]|nr:hypothetical protein [Ktedonobacteraceae bacterium]
MIPVQLQPEPLHFLREVQEPGQRFLNRTSNPTKHWKNHEYWRKILDDLDIAYKGICSYSCHWIPKDTGFRTVEHFKDKNSYPQEAYKWKNYRFVCGTLNGRKGTSENVLDPFCIEEGWFALDFPSLLVQPGDHVSPSIKEQVENTIRILGLNDEGTCFQARMNWLRDYIQVPFPFPYLEKRAPFLASELKRQDLMEKIRDIMIF